MEPSRAVKDSRSAEIAWMIVIAIVVAFGGNIVLGLLAKNQAFAAVLLAVVVVLALLMLRRAVVANSPTARIDVRQPSSRPGQRNRHQRELREEIFPGEEPLGKHVKTNDKTYTIVGIVGDTRHEVGSEPMPVKYLPYHEGRENYGTLVIRSSRDVEQLAMPVQRVIQGLDHDLSVADVLTMNQLLGQSTLDQSFNTTLLTGFAALSLLLAAVGLFGVLSYLAAQRTSEIGIRLALGARREQVLGKMLSDGLRPALIGLALGLAGGVEASRLMRDMLYETKPARSDGLRGRLGDVDVGRGSGLPGSRMARLARGSGAGAADGVKQRSGIRSTGSQVSESRPKEKTTAGTELGHPARS